jgi:hypothetical protein
LCLGLGPDSGAALRSQLKSGESHAQLSPYLTSHILRFGAYATDELHIPPDVFDPALDEVDFGGEQPAAA